MLILNSGAELGVFMLSCPQRMHARRRTLADLALTDIRSPDYVRCGLPATNCTPFEDGRRGMLELLQIAVDRKADFVLLLEDDLRFNRHIGLNIEWWINAVGARSGDNFLGSLYRPSLVGRFKYWHVSGRFISASPALVTGSQALLLSSATALKVLKEWDTASGPHDRRLYSISGRDREVIYHSPSLVQHAEEPSTWSGPCHRANDFNPTWRAPGERS